MPSHPRDNHHVLDGLPKLMASKSRRWRHFDRTCAAATRFGMAGLAVIFVLLQWPLMKKAGMSTTSSTSSLSNFVDQHGKTRLEMELNPPNKAMAQDPLSCQESRKGTECCASWDVSADEWWTQNPGFEVSVENDTTYCFAPTENSEKAAFMKHLHNRQWGDRNDCSNVETSVQSNSGFGASIRWLLFPFWHAHLADKPFQIEWSTRRWLYASANESSWAYCPSEDITCYYLPISPCARNVTNPGQHATARPNNTIKEEMLHFFWLQDYMMRPRHIFRRKLYELRSTLQVQFPCTTMHVRRSDAGLPRPPYRRYAAVQEYIDKAKIQEGSNIVLLTDDESTIVEVKKYHPKYNWIYFDRPRNQGIAGGFDGHIPSGDEGFEMLSIAAELQIAASCDTIVCGMSGFMESLVQRKDAENQNYTLYFVDTRVSKAEAMKFGSKARKRAHSLFQEVEAVNQQRQGK